MRRTVFLFAAAAVIAAAGQSVRADEGGVKLSPVVVTATKTEKDPKDVTQSVTVITADDIKRSGAKTPAEAIQPSIGVFVRDNGPQGAKNSLSIRGSSSAQVLVLLDGKRLNSPREGGYDLSTLPVSIDEIERIEVLRGPSSALYGADAVGGVVNIITKKPKESTSRIETAVGSHGYDLLKIRNANRFDGFYYTISAGRETSNGYRTNSDLDQGRAGAKIGYDFSVDSSVELTADYAGKEVGVPGWRTFPSPFARQWTRDLDAGLSYKGRFSPEFDLSVKTYYNRNKLNYKDPDTFEDDRHKSFTKGVDAHVTWLANAWNLFTIGADARRDVMDSTAAGEHGASQWAGYVQDEMSIGEALIFVLGGRHDSHSVYGDEFSPRASARYYLRDAGVILRASAGEGFRAPTFYDLFFNASWGTGNPSLQPEISKEYEGSVEKTVGKIGSIRVGSFNRKVVNLIEWDLFVFPIRPENIGRAQIRGYEAEVVLTPSKAVTWSVNYTYMNPVNEITGEKIDTIPEHQLNSTLSIAMTTKTNIYFEGRLVENYERPGEAERQYFVIDGRVAQAVSLPKKVQGEIFFSVKNIFDRAYEAVRQYPMPPREIYGGVSVQF